MRTPRTAILAVLVALIAASSAGAQDTYTLKRSFKAGEVDRYKTTASLDAEGGLALTIEITTKETTKEVKDDGSVTVSVVLEKGELMMNGQAMPMPGFTTTTLTTTFDKAGKVIKQEGQAGQLRDLLALTRPMTSAETPLKIGGEWKTEVPTSEDGKNKMSVVVTLVGLEPKSEQVPVESLKVKTIADGVVATPQGEQKMNIETMSFLAKETGKVLKAEGTVKGLKMGPTGDATVKFKLLRLPDAPAEAKDK